VTCTWKCAQAPEKLPYKGSIGDIRKCEKTPRRIGNFQESGKDVGFLGVVFVPGRSLYMTYLLTTITIFAI
jgi:hypothetical protein